MIKKIFKATFGFLAIAALIIGVNAPLVGAYSFYGAGTDENPYRIFTCEQLLEINDDLDGVYKIYRDIDCLDTEFTPIGSIDTPFTGTLDGQGYGVLGITIESNDDYIGVFSAVDSGTIQNLRLNDLVVEGDGYVGGLVGSGTYATITNIYIVGGSVTASGTYVGGLVGNMGGGSIDEAAIVGVNVAAFALVGGIAGQMVGPVSITNTFASGGNLNGISAVGGLVGIIGAGPNALTNSYTAMNISSNGTEIGGLVGNNTNASAISISNLFSVSSMSGTSTADPQSRGGAFGVQQGTISDVYFDVDRSGIAIFCSGTDSTYAGCSAVNTSDNSPNFFINNSTNGPLSAWDFDENGPWVTLENDFPTLYDLVDRQTAIPNDGDANGDGILDVSQPNVLNVPDAEMRYTTIEIPAASGCLVEDGIQYDNTNGYYGTDADYTVQLPTYTGFKIYCDSPEASVPVTLIFDGELVDTSESVLRHLNTDTKTFKTISDAIFETREIGGTIKTIVTYTLTDGGEFDTDSVADGVISDPVTLALYTPEVATIGAPNTGVAPHSLVLILATFIAGLTVIGSGFVLYRKK